MTTANHTPGPWKCGEVIPLMPEDCGERDALRIPIFTDEYLICYVSRQPLGTQQPNAHLIAAAPDMLEVLEDINKWFQGNHRVTIDANTYCCGEPLDMAIQQAIAKARGEQRE